MGMRFHWRLAQAGQLTRETIEGERVTAAAGLLDIENQVAFCRAAERSGIDSLLVDMNYGKPDPLTLPLALARETKHVRFMVAARPGLMSPTLFTQQVNTFSVLAEERISLNIVIGHSPDEQQAYGDYLDHDGRYARLDEWLGVCRAFWRRDGPVEHTGRFYRIAGGWLNSPFVGAGRSRPEIYLGGSSSQARQAAARHADCWLRFADAPGEIRAQAEPLREAGVDVGLRLSVLCRPSRDAALRAARALVDSESARRRRHAESTFVSRSDAVGMRETHALAQQEWLAPGLWTGLVGVLGAPWVCLLGTPDDVAASLLAFRDAGASQFILAGWQNEEEMCRFGIDVLPLVRAAEGRAVAVGV